SGSAHAGNRHGVDVTPAAKLVFVDTVADGQHRIAGWRHDHDQAFGGDGVADVVDLFRRQHLDVVETGIEAGGTHAPGFQHAVSGGTVLNAFGKTQGAGELGQTQGECGIEHRSSPDFVAAQYTTFLKDRQSRPFGEFVAGSN